MILLSDDFLITVLDKTVQERTEGIYNANLHLRSLLLQEVNYMKFIIPDTSKFIDIIMKKLVDNTKIPEKSMKFFMWNALRNELTKTLNSNINNYIKILFKDNKIKNNICGYLEEEIIEHITAISDSLRDKYELEYYEGYTDEDFKEILKEIEESDNIFKLYYINSETYYNIINELRQPPYETASHILERYMLGNSFNTEINYVRDLFNLLSYTDNYDIEEYDIDDYNHNLSHNDYQIYSNFYNSIFLNYIRYKSGGKVNEFIYNFMEIEYFDYWELSVILELSLDMCFKNS